MNTVFAPGQPWGSCTRLAGPAGWLFTPPLDRGRWAQWGLLLTWGWSLSFRPCPPGRRHLIPEPQKGRSQVLAMVSPGVLGWASVFRSHSSPAVSPLPAGAVARRDLCLDQAVVLIEDAIQVGGPALALGLVGAGLALPSGPFTLLSWARLRLLGCVVLVPVLAGIWGLVLPSLLRRRVPGASLGPGHPFRRLTVCPGPVVCCTVVGFQRCPELA